MCLFANPINQITFATCLRSYYNELSARHLTIYLTHNVCFSSLWNYCNAISTFSLSKWRASGDRKREHKDESIAFPFRSTPVLKKSDIKFLDILHVRYWCFSFLILLTSNLTSDEKFTFLSYRLREVSHLRYHRKKRVFSF